MILLKIVLSTLVLVGSALWISIEINERKWKIKEEWIDPIFENPIMILFMPWLAVLLVATATLGAVWTL